MKKKKNNNLIEATVKTPIKDMNVLLNQFIAEQNK